MKTALTIAGSDSSGGAGIQADLKTFSVLGVYGMTAITAVTAQNTLGVKEVVEMTPAFVRNQIDTTTSDISADATKTGMLVNAEMIEVVEDCITRNKLQPYVCDPVMVSKSGASLLKKDAVSAMVRMLFPLATIVTPNLREAAALTGVDRIDPNIAPAKDAAKRIIGLDAKAQGVDRVNPLKLMMIGGMQEPMGYEIPSARKIFGEITVPKIMAGRVRTLEEAEQLLREGGLDMVGMVRAQIADPDLIRKTLEGRADQVRPCIACNQGCIGGVMRGTGLGCTVNAAAGFEAEYSEDLITPTRSPKRVVIVGGGPAGMEAARVARLCGHETTLFEAAPTLGGAITAAQKPARQHALGDITAWLESEVYRLGVDVRLSTYVEASDLEALGADVILVATGSRPRMDGWQVCDPSSPASGVEMPHVLSSIDLLMSPPAILGTTALVVDNVGHFEASVVAIDLIEKGLAVTMLTSTREYAPYVRTTDRDDSMLEQLYRGDFTLLVNHKLEEIRSGECVVRPMPSNRTRTIPADLVVLVTPNMPNRELFDELKQPKGKAILIGDAKSPRDLQMAIRDGHRAARAIA